ncbi:MAG: hypothetical protein JWN47_2395, partial [Frankiales bacterium]|nr:hypothetical protein [Frankiales bacterium]
MKRSAAIVSSVGSSGRSSSRQRRRVRRSCRSALVLLLALVTLSTSGGRVHPAVRFMVTSPAEGASLISAAPTITGTAEPATLVILDGPFGVRTEADASGSWTMTISDRRPLTVGRQTLTLENFACELDQYAHGACPPTALAIR